MPPRPGRPRQARRPTGAGSYGSGWPGTPCAVRRRQGRLPGHQARHRDCGRRQPLRLPAGVVGGSLGEPHRSRHLAARPLRPGGRARCPDQGAGLGALEPDRAGSMPGSTTPRWTPSTGCPTATLSRTAARPWPRAPPEAARGRGPRGLVALCGGVDVNADRVPTAAAPGVIPGRPPGRGLDRVQRQQRPGRQRQPAA